METGTGQACYCKLTFHKEEPIIYQVEKQSVL